MKVKSVRRVKLASPVPVYDLTVQGTENFKLANGPFVHNSKDCSDALAGVVHGLTTRREIWGMYHIPIMRIPDAIRSVKDNMKTGVEQQEAVILRADAVPF